MKRRNALTCSLWAAVFVAAACLLGALGYLAYNRILTPGVFAQRDAARPTVSILAPRYGEQVAVASNIAVQVEARVSTGQVVLLQLWADGELVGEQSGAAARLSAQWVWTPRAPGDHTLTARAYNETGDSGAAMARVTAIEAADADHDGVPDQADTCPDHPGLLQLEGCPPGMAGGSSENPESQAVADAWVGPGEEEESGSEAVSGGEPGSIQGNQERPAFDDSDFPPGQQAIVENCAICDWLERQGGRTYSDAEAISGIGLEVEALSLRTAGGLSDVFCYARLQNSQWERVPADQDEFFEPLGEGFWNVSNYLGGERGRSVVVTEGEPLRLDVRCYGRLGDMLTPSLHLGEVIREHGPADWNGQTFTARGQDGANWFDLSYRICGIPCEDGVIPPPYNLQLRRNEGNVVSYALSWRWDGDPASIDGYRIYRDGNLLAVEYGADHPFTILSQSTAEPECSDEYRFEARAYKGTQESAPSNPIFSAATASCRFRNELEVYNVTLPTPQRADLVVDLNYWYDGDHGEQAHVFVLPLQGDRPPGWPNLFHINFSLATATVQTGAGNTRVHVYYGGAEPMTTDGLRLVMMDEDNEYFYTRVVPLQVQWYPSGPDLAWGGISIISPSRQAEGQTMHDLTFRLVNRGYARLLWTPSLQIRLGNGQLAIPTEDWDNVWLTPGGSASIVWSVPEDIWMALAPTYEVTLDPDNAIAELNEGNNTLMGSTKRLRVTFDWIYAPAELHGYEIPWLYVGLNGRFQVNQAGNTLGALAFRGGAHDEWVDDVTDNGLFLCHEEGVSIGTNWPSDVREIFRAIDPAWCMAYTAEYPHVRQGADIAGLPLIWATSWPWDPQGGPHENAEDWCNHLAAQGYIPGNNYENDHLDIIALPDRPLSIGVHLDELDVSYDGIFNCSDHYDLICEVSQEISPEQLQHLPLSIEVGSAASDGCSVKVDIEEVSSP